MKVKDIDVCIKNRVVRLGLWGQVSGFEPQLCHLLTVQFGSVTSPLEMLNGSFAEMRMNLENVIQPGSKLEREKINVVYAYM